MLRNESSRTTLQVAPLILSRSNSDLYLDASSSSSQTTTNATVHSEMTPPATPNEAHEVSASVPTPPPVFHNFLRAFYPFNPSYALTDSSVTLPLDEGDVVLIHSIHTNGWADGTLLLSGARGWLPTNYCEAYEPDEMRNLLKGLLNFWDLLRSTSVDDGEIFGNQDFMKGLIAGVRILLERCDCLNRESSIIQKVDALRKCRKSLLSELSSLVKTAKRLQEGQRGTLDPPEDVNDIVDEMILKAFRIVTKGVRFLDILEEDKRARAPLPMSFMATVTEENLVPPTPPADQATFDSETKASVDTASANAATLDTGDAPNAFPLPWTKRVSSMMAPAASTAVHRSSMNSQGNRLSAGIAHRLSLAGPTSSEAHNLVSERLNKSHDTFLSHLGSFIGRLHLGTPSRPELAIAVKQSASSGGELLAVVDAVCAHSDLHSNELNLVREFTFEQIQELVNVALQTLVNAPPEEDVITPSDNRLLLSAATSCVRAAGECVVKTKGTIEHTGDFELELENTDLGIDLSVLTIAPSERASSPVHHGAQTFESGDETTDTDGFGQRNSSSSSSSNHTTSSSVSKTRRGTFVAVEKPLPETPYSPTTTTPTPTPAHPEPLTEPTQETPSLSCHARAKSSSVSSSRPSVPALPKLSTRLPGLEQDTVLELNSAAEDYNSSHFDSVIASSAVSSATYLSRDSETSVVSQTSTRATTPDHTLQPRKMVSTSDLSAADSALTEEVEDVESKLMEKTFAHELMFNKEGQVTAGSLVALVERLTTHEYAPDATFVSTFYLTFRLFCTPVKFAEALIDRFQYIGDSIRAANPVRLRVYNVFKGWLEAHWRDATDSEALPVIIFFAEHQLTTVLPSAGRRLVELAQRVSNEPGMSSRLLSTMGKTNTAIAQHIPADTPLPSPALSKSQQNLLTAFKTGGATPTILDFEPIELARQLTIKQMGIFCSIMPEELLASLWTKKNGMHAPHVKAMSSLSTDVSNLVAETILQYPEIKKRAAVIKHWIKIAHRCFELHNYDGLMAIVCSLNSSTISRLRKTWDTISPKRKDMLRQLQELVEPGDNNKNNRILRGLLHDHVPPCLPFLGMYLTDLAFVDIGNPSTRQMCNGSDHGRGNGLTVINFDKHMRTARIIGELQRFQIAYRLTELPDMQHWMSSQIKRVRDGDQGNMANYYRRSLLLEPRESQKPAASEPTTPSLTSIGGSRENLFAWMTRDRTNTNTTPAPV